MDGLISDVNNTISAKANFFTGNTRKSSAQRKLLFSI